MTNLNLAYEISIEELEADFHKSYKSIAEEIAEMTEEEEIQAQIEFLGKPVDELFGQTKEEENKKCKVISLEEKRRNLEKGDTMQLKLHSIMLDSKEYEEKPKGAEIGAIQNRLSKSETKVNILDLADALTRGRTFKPCLMSGKSNDTFVSSSLIVLDIDNKGEELEEYGYKSIDSFLEDVEKSMYKPAIIYTTFSHTEECNKYRAIFQLDREVTNFEYLKQIHDVILEDYPYADKKVHPAAVIFGGIELIKLNALAVVEIKDFVFKEEKANTQQHKKRIVKAVSYNVNNKDINLDLDFILKSIKANYSHLRNIKLNYYESFDFINENIKMTDVFNVSLNDRFRCILHDHNDEHPSARISDELEGGQRYMCSCVQGLKLLDVLRLITKKDKSFLAYKIAKALNFKLGSEYQEKWIWTLVNAKRNFHEDIEEYEVLNKYMQRRKLYSIYLVLVDMAMENIPAIPLNDNEDSLTFFVSNERISRRMILLNIPGADMRSVNNKINALKELGLIRALNDSEIRPNLLNESNKIRTEAALANGNIKRNRVDYYELRFIAEVVDEAETFIQQAKACGLKFSNNNVIRRTAAIGEEKTQEVNVQVNVSEVYNSKKVQKRMTKIIDAAKELIDEQSYFTVDQLRNKFDPYRKVQKKMQIKYINDALPTIIRLYDIKEDRMKKSLCQQFDIDSKIKTNTLIYHI